MAETENEDVDEGREDPTKAAAEGARARRRRRKEIRRYVRYYAVLPLIAILSRLPLRAARWLGWAGGLLGWVFAAKERRRAMENLTAAFGGEKSRREISRICRGVFRNTATNVFELLVVHRWSMEKIRKAFPLAEDFRRLREAIPEGAVGITAHFGNWELLGILLQAFEPGLLVPVAKRIYFPPFQRLVERFREGAGLEVIYTDDSPRRQIRAIEDRKLLGLLPDQDLKAVNGVFVEFFGRPAYTSTIPANLARITGRDFLACFLLRHGDGFRIRFRKFPASATGRREEDLLESTRRWTAVLEEEVRGAIDQWVWFHRRWRTRPEDGARKVGRRRAAVSVDEGMSGPAPR